MFDPKYNESDLFASFSNMMVDLRDGFLRELDKEDSGIEGHVRHYIDILELLDPQLYGIIENNNVPH